MSSLPKPNRTGVREQGELSGESETPTGEPVPALARVFPVGGAAVLSTRWKLAVNAALIAMPLSLSLLLLPLIALTLWLGPAAWPFSIVAGAGPARPFWFLLAGAVIVLGAQALWASSYPEWPMNRWLHWRLRRRCSARAGSWSHELSRAGEAVSSSEPVERWIKKARMVEWVPRENWSTTRLDTAEDVMLLRITDEGIRMMGDRCDYRFPAASLIAAEIESIRPTGCFHWLHFVVLVVRTAEGPMEFPIAFRDHRLGCLRSRHRYRGAVALVRELEAMLKASGEWGFSEAGGFWSESHPPHSQAGRRRRFNSSHDDQALNPYAAPRGFQA